MVFRQELATSSYVEWVNENRDHLKRVRDAMSDMLSEPADGSTVVKDRMYLADVLRDIAQVLEKRSLKNTMFDIRQ